jgi:hypothetical protein
MAVIERVPADTLVVLNAATPLLSAFDPSVTVPSLNVTPPVGVPAVEVTLTVNVTDCPYVDGFSDEIIAEVVVAALFTVCVRIGDVLPVKFVSPAYTAVIECEPPAKVEVANVADPPLRAFVPSDVVPFLNVTLPVGVPEVAGVTVAVNVTDCPKLDGFSDEPTAVVVDCFVLVVVFKFNVSTAKSVHPEESSGPQAVRLNVTFVMFGPVESFSPMYMASPVLSLVSLNVPSKVVPLNAWTCTVNCPGAFACTKAPAPDSDLENVNVIGPFPELPLSEVQIKLSPALRADPPSQLHGVAVQSTETMLFAPASEIVMPTPPPDVAPKLAPRTVWSAPNCDQFTVSFAAWPATEVTLAIVSAQAPLAVRQINPASPHISTLLTPESRAWFSIGASLYPLTHSSPYCVSLFELRQSPAQFDPPGGHAFAFPVNVPLSEYNPPAPNAGGPKNHE